MVIHMDKTRLEKVIDEYIKNKVDNTEDDVQEMLRTKLIQDVEEEVYYKYKEDILRDVREQIDDEDKVIKIRQLKLMVIETLIIGILVGLLVNQFTDGISYFKGVTTINMQGTGWCILLLLISIAVCGLVMYWHKLDQFIIEKSMQKYRDTKKSNDAGDMKKADSVSL